MSTRKNGLTIVVKGLPKSGRSRKLVEFTKGYESILFINYEESVEELKERGLTKAVVRSDFIDAKTICKLIIETDNYDCIVLDVYNSYTREKLLDICTLANLKGIDVYISEQIPRARVKKFLEEKTFPQPVEDKIIKESLGSRVLNVIKSLWS